MSQTIIGEACELESAEGTSSAGAMIQSSVIERTIAERNHCIEEFLRVYDRLEAALDSLPSLPAHMGGGGRTAARELLEQVLRYGTAKDAYADQVRKFVDAAAWQAIINDHGFEKLMDRKARKEFQDQLEKDPPELTYDAAHATLSGLLQDADMLFMRGIAEAFSKLDRRFRSHDGFKIGSRIILSYALSEYGSWHRNHDDTLRDIERVFCRLAGTELPTREDSATRTVSNAVNKLNRASGTFPVVIDTQFFKFRAFQNGNLHIWFKDNDLVRQCNKLLAEYYGEVLGVAPDAAEVNPLDKPNRSLARTTDYFPTPEGVIARMLDRVSMWRYEEGFRVLEPSAGTGHIALALLAANEFVNITCVEADPRRAAELADNLIKARKPKQTVTTMCRDFLDCDPGVMGWFERIYMNPPFSMQQDIDHVAHAAKFLSPGGKLIAVMAAGVEFRENKKAVAFRELIKSMNGTIQDLPERSFAEYGTNVNTVLVTLTRKP